MQNNTNPQDVVEFRANARRATMLLKAMANQSRLLILCFLAQSEKSVGELQALLGISQSALSQHLAILRRDDLVETRRLARSIVYSIASPAAEALMGVLYEHFCQQPSDATAQRDAG